MPLLYYIHFNINKSSIFSRYFCVISVRMDSLPLLDAVKMEGRQINLGIYVLRFLKVVLDVYFGPYE